ncbi:MAG: RDD family protein [Acidimicrobiales bacterium]
MAATRSAERPGRGIVTPEAVLLDFERASVGSRALAQAIDVGVRFVGLLAVATVFGSVGAVQDQTTAVVVFSITGFLLLFAYPAFWEARYDGRTIGKRAMGLRVVTVDGAPVSFRHTSIRSLLAIVDFLLPPVGVVATWTVLLSRRNQRLGDVLAGTIVLRERTGARLPVPVSFPPLPGYEAYARSLDVGALRPEQYAVVRSFLTRVNDLRPDVRARLGAALASPIAAAMHHTPPPNVTAESFLVSVAAAYQLRLGGPPVPLTPWVHPWGPDSYGR